MLTKKYLREDDLKKSKKNSEHYDWGNNCNGWYLVKSEGLSVIEELMPPQTQDKKHYHNHSQQFFRILNGKAAFEIENKIIEVENGKGIHIPSKVKHRVRNDQSEDLEFIVISESTTLGDKFDVLDE